MPKIVHEKMLANTNKLKAFKNQQGIYVKNNEKEKLIAMQFIDQHNLTVELRKKKKSFKKFIRDLHLNQEELINFLFEEDFINENEKAFLLDIVIHLKLNTIIKVENPFFNF